MVAEGSLSRLGPQRCARLQPSGSRTLAFFSRVFFLNRPPARSDVLDHHPRVNVTPRRPSLVRTTVYYSRGWVDFRDFFFGFFCRLAPVDGTQISKYNTSTRGSRPVAPHAGFSDFSVSTFQESLSFSPLSRSPRALRAPQSRHTVPKHTRAPLEASSRRRCTA